MRLLWWLFSSLCLFFKAISKHICHICSLFLILLLISLFCNTILFWNRITSIVSTFSIWFFLKCVISFCLINSFLFLKLLSFDFLWSFHSELLVIFGLFLRISHEFRYFRIHSYLFFRFFEYFDRLDALISFISDFSRLYWYKYFT